MYIVHNSIFCRLSREINFPTILINWEYIIYCIIKFITVFNLCVISTAKKIKILYIPV